MAAWKFNLSGRGKRPHVNPITEKFFHASRWNSNDGAFAAYTQRAPVESSYRGADKDPIGTYPPYPDEKDMFEEEWSDLLALFSEPGNSPDHENCRWTTRDIESSTALVRGREGFEVRGPFFPGRIQVNSQTGSVTLLPASGNRLKEGCKTKVPRNIPNEIAGRGSTTGRKIIPGQNIALRHVVQLKFVRVEHSDGSLHADQCFVHGNEVFSVVSLPLNENFFALKTTETHRYISCKDGGETVRATCEGWHVGIDECFMEEDAGEGKTAIRSVKLNQYLGGYHLKLSGTVSEMEKFEVLPASNVF
ncbi:hypothetical protein R1flu_026057 [Riccia fluitans]|uniref:Uncharacterized protein n=1 Tax=Riccia fluitans TaxID=41844 RepID=A0ABD1XFF9_9MARC